MQTHVTAWLNEGLKHYQSGDAARALEAWYRILEVEPEHAAALEYVAFVRASVRVEPAVPETVPEPTSAPVPAVTTPPATTSSSLVSESWGDMIEPAPAIAAAPVEPTSPLPAPEPAPEQEPAPLPTVARWASPKVQPKAAAEPKVEAFEPLDFDAPTEGLSTPPPSPPPSPSPPPTLVDVPASPTLAAVPPAASVKFDIDLDDDISMPPPRPELLRAPTPAPSVPPSVPVSPPQLVVVVSPEQPLEERVVKQSVRFDEPRSLSNPSMAVPSPPLQAVAMPQPEPHANAPTKAAPIDVPTDAQSPWDIGEGPASTLDLDTTSRNTASPFTELLATSAVKPKTPSESLPATTSSAPAPSPVSAPPQESELDALMTGARELFELGDFSGSLELVEKVLRTDAGHEGARAYLKRNEATLTRMYESKLGAMSTVPRQLVPPDEVIWLNMHHRAGFILSQVDGMLSYEDLLEVSGMDRFDTVRILADLVQNGIIG